MMRAVCVAAGLAAFLLGAGAAMGAEPAKASSAVKGPRVTVAGVRQGDIVESVQLTGTLVAREDVLVSAEIDGLRITDLLAEEGQSVAKGQVLARLSRETLDAQLAQNDAALAKTDAAIAQAKSQIVQSEAQLQQAQQALERTTQLRKTGFASQATFDLQTNDEKAAAARLTAARDGLVVSQADRAAIEAQRRELNIRLQRTEVKAPAAGVIYRRSAKTGGLAAMAGEPMFRLIADGDVELEAEVPEVQVNRIAVGLPASITVGDVTEVGLVRLVSPEIDKATRLGRIRIQVKDRGSFKIGAFARGKVETKRVKGLAVPLSAVLYGEKGPFVQTVKDGAIVTAPIRTGVIAGREVEAVSGLKGDEKIVVKAGAFLRDGDAVTPVDEGAH